MLVRSRSLALSHNLLAWLVALNLLFALLLGLVFGLTFLLDHIVAPRMNDPRELAEIQANLPAIRAVMLIAIGTSGVAHLLLKRLAAIVASVREGTPFLAENADRLRAIAWLLLGIQLLDLGFAWVDYALVSDDYFRWSFTITPWLAILLLFVLARVFREGTRMSEDLEGTV